MRGHNQICALISNRFGDGMQICRSQAVAKTLEALFVADERAERGGQGAGRTHAHRLRNTNAKRGKCDRQVATEVVPSLR